jgi:hypothetical protein
MADLITLLSQMNSNGAFATIGGNAIAQFGTPVRRYVGAEILPERKTNENAYREALIRYRTVVANDSPRFSPAQKKGGVDMLGEMLVETGTQDIAVEMTGRDYDALVQASLRGNTVDVQNSILQWVDLRVNRALIEKSEIQRFQALVNSSVVRVGQNGYSETIDYPSPTGHRVTAAGAWSNDTIDPFDDLIAMHELLASKGYRTSRIITSTSVVSLLSKNAKVSSRTGTLQVNSAGSLVSSGGFATVNSINQMLQSNGLPIIETYDATYRNENGTMGTFLPAGTMLFVAEAGQDPATFTFESETRVVSNPLGYLAVGRGAGQTEPGRVINVAAFVNKPPRIEAEGYQESLPVITEPEAIAVISGIA